MCNQGEGVCVCAREESTPRVFYRMPQGAVCSLWRDVMASRGGDHALQSMARRAWLEGNSSGQKAWPFGQSRAVRWRCDHGGSGDVACTSTWDPGPRWGISGLGARAKRRQGRLGTCEQSERRSGSVTMWPGWVATAMGHGSDVARLRQSWRSEAFRPCGSARACARVPGLPGPRHDGEV